MSSTAGEIQERVAAWGRVNARLDELARRELPRIETGKVLEYLRPAFEHARKGRGVRPISGLIEQQRLFRTRHGA